MNFYCQKRCGENDFSIDEWNKDYKSLINSGMSESDINKILHPEPCKIQCDACINIVLETQKKNKEIRERK